MHNEEYYKYLGVEFKYDGKSIEEGFDCINICCAIAKDRGVPMKNINHSFVTNTTYYDLFNQRNDVSEWQELKETDSKQDSLVVFKVNGKIGHVGYMLDDSQFIHIMEQSRVSVEKVTSPQWEKRVIGFYKYIGK